MVMYADDTTLHCTIDSVYTSSTMKNDELKMIIRWLTANHYMGFHMARKLIDYSVFAN